MEQGLRHEGNVVITKVRSYKCASKQARRQEQRTGKKRRGDINEEQKCEIEEGNGMSETREESTQQAQPQEKSRKGRDKGKSC